MYEYEQYPPLREMAIAAVRAEAITEFPARVLLTVWACESAWGTRVTGDFNYWGITRLPEAGLARMCATHEDLTPAELEAFDPRERATAQKEKDLGKGKARYSMMRYFASYVSLGESVIEYMEFF